MSQHPLNLKSAFAQPLILIKGLLLPLLLLALWQYNSSLGASHAYAFVPLQKVYFAFIQLLETGEYDCVFAWEISRIARRKKILFSILEYLTSKGIQ